MKTFIDHYIEKQALISAVEKFSQKLDNKQIELGQKKYRDLIPSKIPGEGQQYAFEVDLDKCTGCKACVTACHHENGLDIDESWREVGFVHGGTGESAAIQHITSACHHCLEPACLEGCPTLAYTKDPDTGIVKHLDDQCFGCQYCIFKCPYDVPKYNKKRGIVRKCDMCIDRLQAGQAPACARACPNGAIRITVVDKADVAKHASDYVDIPDAPASTYTYPTTRYRTKKIFPADMESEDYYLLKPEHAHWPLVMMLVLTQLSVGAFLAEFILKMFLNPAYHKAFDLFHVPLALGLGLLALAASVFHLGRPHLVFRAFLGFRTSWLSREIIAFGGFAALAVVYALASWVEPLEQFFAKIFFGFDSLSVLAVLVVFAGELGIYCSAMVYRDTKRPFWDNPLTTLKFFLSSIILGFCTILLSLTLFSFFHQENFSPDVAEHFGSLFAEIICLAMILKLISEALILLHRDQKNLSALKKTVILMTQPLKKHFLWRFGCGIGGGLMLPLLFLRLCHEAQPEVLCLLTILFFAMTLTGEFLERYLFFRAVVPLKMPGAK